MIIKTYACDRCGLKEHDRIALNSVALSKLEGWKIDERTGSCLCRLCVQYTRALDPVDYSVESNNKEKTTMS